MMTDWRLVYKQVRPQEDVKMGINSPQHDDSVASCPHCGTTLPTGVGAFCPECREPLPELENATHEAAPDGVQATLPKRRSRKWPWIVLGLLALLLVLRETGLVNLDLYRFSSTENTNSRYDSVTVAGLGGRATETAAVKAKDQTVAAQAAANALRDMHLSASVDLQKLDISGLYWLPFYKRGTCNFAASYSLHGTDHGQVHGHIDCTVTGVCSAYTYRQIIGRLVAKEIAREINR